MKGLFRLLDFVWSHPMNKDRRVQAIGRVLRWQIASRLMPGPICLPFVHDTWLIAQRGMTGATGNWYCGLHEYEDMSFVLHALRPRELFLDVGANIGSYSILAAGGGANVISVEPIPRIFRALQRNIAFNAFEGRIEAVNIGLGSIQGELRFSADQDTVNHVLAEHETSGATVSVPVRRLDDLLEGRVPVMIKIDVEGFETRVLEGAVGTLCDPKLLAVIMELNGSGERYGFDEDAVHRKMLAFGFETYAYDPALRCLSSLGGERHLVGNTLYVRSAQDVGLRLSRHNHDGVS